ncbi:ArgC Acetylglutamate semialdehyde dehydrogenase [actinobacterium SCGC AAA044-D11]
MKIGVVGASGYAGGELLRILASHENFEVVYASAGSNAGELITSIHPQLISYSGQKFGATDLAEINKCDLVFLALPHGESGSLVSQIAESVKVVDLGADFRLANEDSWRKYYSGEYAGKFVYGLPELGDNRKLISVSNRVTNPGCYATAIILGSAPAVSSNLVDNHNFISVAASGTTGAGRNAKINLSASEVMNNMSSYKFGGVHQHTPEIEECLSAVGDSPVKFSFTPILAPMPRGILATISSQLKKMISTEQAHQIYSQYFAKSDFVKMLPIGELPQTSMTIGTNFAFLQVAVDEHANRLMVSVAIDNLGKGAAGQAIQNANLMCGYPEITGLNQSAAK